MSLKFTVKDIQDGSEHIILNDSGYPLYSQEHEDDPIVIAKLFDPFGSATWYLLEYDPVEKITFGYLTGTTADEFGYVSLTEMESIQGPLGIGIEQDIYFVQKRLSEVK
ncbi:DUF2958 domain-containing protein [bacterium]|nr:DUF2958 domain-containing protein [bacterium]